MIITLLILLGVMLTWTLYHLFNKVLERVTVVKYINRRKEIQPKNLKIVEKVVNNSRKKENRLLYPIERKLSEASINMDAKKFLTECVSLCFIFALAVFIVTRSILITILIPFILAFFVIIALDYLRNKRIEKFIDQLPNILDFISGSLKAGYSLMQSVNLIAEEGLPPGSVEFTKVLQDIHLGKTYEEAFDSLVQRNPGEEVEILAAAILISKETGGNLTSILDTVANTLREKQKLHGEVKSLSAQGRLSGLILILLPLGLFTFLVMTNPDYIKPLFSQTKGQILLSVAFGFQVIGAVLIRKIVKIDW